MTAPLEGEIEVASTAEEFVSPKQDQSYDLPYPMWAGLGVAYRDLLVQGLTMTADVAWTQWSDVDEIVRTTEEELPGGIGTQTLDWEDTIEVGVGLDYRASRTLSLRMGYRSVPSPGSEENYTFVLPQIEKSVISLGATYRRDTWHADLSLEYGAGQEVEIPVDGGNDMNGKHLEDSVVASLALIYSF